MNRIILTLLLMGGIYTVMRGTDAPTLPSNEVQGIAQVHDGDSFTVAGGENPAVRD